jgi:RND family efflux transporter MFP subunit
MTVSEGHEVAPPARGFKYGKLVLALSALGLATLVGWRVQDALATRAQVGEERVEVARKAQAAASGPRQVEIVHGTAGVLRPRVGLEGSLAPLEEADVGFKVGGRLAQVKVTLGTQVKAGQLLGLLDASEAAAQLRAAEAALRAAEAELVLATDNADRTAKVVASGAMAENMGVQTTQQRELTRARRDGAEAQLQLARQALGNHRVTAPFGGVVTKAPSGPGEVVAPGTSLFHVSNLSKLKLVGSVRAEEAELVRVGAPVVLRASHGREARGVVTAVIGSLDEKSKRVPVHAELENLDDHGLIAGSLVQATIVLERELPIVRLPSSVLKPGSQDEIFVVNGETLSARRIEFSVAEDGTLLVRSGVTPADAVLARPWPEAKPGDRAQARQ